MKYLALAIGLLTVTGCHAADKVSPSDFYGTWKVAKILAVGDGSQSEAQMNALIGTRVVISAQQMEEGGDVCPLASHTVTAAMVDTAKVLDLPGDLTPQQIGLPKQAPMLDVGCEQFFLLNGRLIFSDRGAYYSAERINGQ